MSDVQVFVRDRFDGYVLGHRGHTSTHNRYFTDFSLSVARYNEHRGDLQLLHERHHYDVFG